MSGWLSIDIRCAKCEHVWDDIIKRVELTDETEFECPKCGGTGKRTINKMMPYRAIQRLRKGDWEDLKGIAKAEKEMFDKPVEERGQYKKEIHERKKIK